MRKPKPNDKVFIKTIPQYTRESGKECKVENYALGVVFVRPKYSRELIEVLPEDLDYVEFEKLSGQEKRDIIGRLVKSDLLQEDKDYIREMGILNRLVDHYPDIDFWKQFSPTFQVKSLIWWFGGGKDDIIKLYNIYTLDLSPAKSDIKLLKDKIGEDLVNTKPKNILDLLK